MSCGQSQLLRSSVFVPMRVPGSNRFLLLMSPVINTFVPGQTKQPSGYTGFPGSSKRTPVTTTIHRSDRTGCDPAHTNNISRSQSDITSHPLPLCISLKQLLRYDGRVTSWHVISLPEGHTSVAITPWIEICFWNIFDPHRGPPSKCPILHIHVLYSGPPHLVHPVHVY